MRRAKMTHSRNVLMGFRGSCASTPARAPPSLNVIFVVHSPQRYWSYLPDSADGGFTQAIRRRSRHDTIRNGAIPEDSVLLAGNRGPVRRVDRAPTGGGDHVTRPTPGSREIVSMVSHCRADG